VVRRLLKKAWVVPTSRRGYIKQDICVLPFTNYPSVIPNTHSNLCEGEVGKLVFDDLPTLLSETFKKLLSVSFSSAKLGVSHLVGFGFVT